MRIDVKIITDREHRQIERQCAVAGADPKYFFLPGMAWGCPWYNNPLNVNKRKQRQAQGLKGSSFLSIEYWQDYAEIRPPIKIVCPGGYQWLIDGKQPDGRGWGITENGSGLSAFFPVKVPGFCGGLREGVLTDES